MVISSVLTGIFQDRKKRVGTITAPPGSGKSYLALFLGSLLKNDPKWNSLIDSVLERQKSIHTKRISSEITEFRKLNESYLPVYFVGDIHDYRKTILSTILIELSKERDDLSEILYEAFQEDMGMMRKSSRIENLIERISTHYASGDLFFQGYKILIGVLESSGFGGVVLIHDEFNRFLISEQSGDSTDLDFLQDLAEFQLRQKNFRILHYLLLHKGISQYLSGISGERRKDWLKIEGRFYSYYFQEDISDTYGLISYYIENSGKIRFFKSVLDSKKIQSEIMKAFQVNRFLEREIGTELREISLKAYPLHISTLVALPFLCNLFGQNERSLYGYLSDIQQRQFKDFIYLQDLFDYFDSSIDQLGLEDRLLSRWIHGRNALAESLSVEEESIVKSLTILSVIGKPNLLPAIVSWIHFSCFGHSSSSETRKILEGLRKRNLAIYREGNKTYQIHYGSSINLEERIREELSSIREEDISKALEVGFPLRPIYGKKFNSENYTSRFYSRHFLLEESIRDQLRFSEDLGENSKQESFQEKFDRIFESLVEELYTKNRNSGISGIIMYYIGSPQSDLTRALKNWLSHSKSEISRKIFVFFSTHSFRDPELIKRYAVVELRISNNQELLSIDPRVESDLRILLSDLQEKVTLQLKNLFPADQPPILPVHFKKIEPLKYDLSELLSAILAERFPNTPRINQELINRENITPIIRNTRKKIMRDMLEGETALGTKVKGYGPDVSIFRSLFTVKGLYSVEEGKTKYDFSQPVDFLGRKDRGLSEVFREIFYFYDEKSETQSFEWIYKRLTSDPYGLYSEVIPFYLLGALLERNYSFSLYEEGRYEKEINSDILEKIHATPEKFRIKILREDRITERYLLGLQKLFGKNEGLLRETSNAFESKKLSENKVYRAVVGLLYWYTRLPEYTKKTTELEVQEREWMQLIPVSSNPEILLLEELPSIFQVNLLRTDDKELESFLERLETSKQRIENQYPFLISDLHNRTIKHFSEYTRSKDTSLKEVLSSFLEENSYKIEILRKNEPSFLKLHDRLRLTYDSDAAFLESLALLLSGLHPRYWKDDTINEFEFKLTTELSKLHIAGLMSGKESPVTLRMNHFIQQFQNFDSEEQIVLFDRIKEIVKDRI
ncbi:MAG: hypothetical protein KDK54_21875, partial [Leptospiraceae bacterium]|nr:hypothetical protein [Leptospiraceae bacterium]